MKLRATITIDLETDNIMTAKETIDELQEDLQPLESKYGEIRLDVRERRGPRASPRDN